MILSVTHLNSVYLAEVVSVWDAERHRRLYLVQWAGGDFLLLEWVPVFGEWLQHEGAVLDRHLHHEVLSVLKDIISQKLLTEEISLTEAMNTIFDLMRPVVVSLPQRLPQSA